MSEREVTEGRLLSQSFGVNPPAVVEVQNPAQRPIELITQDIRTHQMAFQHLGRLMVTEAIEIGRYLEEAKAALPHGQWGGLPQERGRFLRVHRPEFHAGFSGVWG